jgi:hypothetical protein
LTEAMVRFAARFEYARTVEDVLARRSRLLFLDARKAIDMAPASQASCRKSWASTPSCLPSWHWRNNICAQKCDKRLTSRFHFAIIVGFAFKA